MRSAIPARYKTVPPKKPSHRTPDHRGYREYRISINSRAVRVRYCLVVRPSHFPHTTLHTIGIHSPHQFLLHCVGTPPTHSASRQSHVTPVLHCFGTMKTALQLPQAFAEVLNYPHIETFLLRDDGTFPNSRLPLIIFRNALKVTGVKAEETFKKLFAHHDWRNNWVANIYDFHHYHSTAHEVLGVAG